MAKPDWLEEKEQPKPIIVSKCWDCDHCGKLHSWRKIGSKKHYTRWCNLHNIEVGESSATCQDGTNIIPFGGWRARMPKVQNCDGWEDY